MLAPRAAIHYTTAVVARAKSTSGAAGAAADAPTLAPSAALSKIAGIGPRTYERLAAQGLRTVGDLIGLLPRRYRELVELAAPADDAVGRLVRVPATVRGARLVWLPGRRSMVTVEFAAADGTPFAAPFFNQPWLKNSYAEGQARVVEGTLQKKGRRFVVHQARVLNADAAPAGTVQLRYPEVEGVAPGRLLQWLAQALQRVDWTQLALPPLPQGLSAHDADVRSLYLAMHRPASVQEHERARTHFAVREAVALFGKVAQARQRRAQRRAVAYPVDGALAARIRARLPFVLTGDQETAVQLLWQKLRGPAPMGVLLQGDVGTGKTAVAVAAALAVLARGHQVAFLAPTELLAEQHWRLCADWLRDGDVGVDLLTASRDDRDRKALLQALAAGGPRLVFGTHALLSDDTRFAQLGLVIVDEQHRFGVAQRMQLVHKAADPHVLVMTATPIPRTLALTLFGDLDLALLRQRPHRALPRAVHADTARWPRVLRSIARAIRRNGRVYVVCPAVGEDGEKGGAVRLFDALAATFCCRLVHGRMAIDEQQAAIDAFRDGSCDVLVGTTVLEVGVDVPEATLMVVAPADRFGLATLHQLRGRVGRGQRRGLCILCGPKTARVDALCRTTDGFELAEHDLRLRGSGELLGTAQSGFADLRALDPIEDRELLLAVRAAVAEEPCA